MDDINYTKNEQVEPDVIDMMRKIQQQLVFLEKKIDTLINQSSGKRFEAKRFSKPLRPFDHSRYHGKGQQDSASRERSFSTERRFDQKKKPFFHHRKERV